MDGSRFTEPVPGVTVGCMSQEARDLLDCIMDEYRKHYERTPADIKGTHPDDVYRFAYWLVRWSGLVQPNKTT